MREQIEADVEAHFVKRVEELGGVAEKTRAIGSRGYFDRVAVIPLPRGTVQRERGIWLTGSARVIFAELKRPKGGVVAIHQEERRKRYVAMGAEAIILKTKAQVDALLGAGR